MPAGLREVETSALREKQKRRTVGTALAKRPGWQEIHPFPQVALPSLTVGRSAR